VLGTFVAVAAAVVVVISDISGSFVVDVTEVVEVNGTSVVVVGVWHSRSFVVVPTAVSTCVAVQVVHSVQLVWFAFAVNLPVPHALQLRSLLAFPVNSTNSPGWQTVHSVQASWFAFAVNLPVPHALQLRSLLAFPANSMNFPGWQTVHSAQASSFAFAANFALAQASQNRSFLNVPFAFTCVPAKQFDSAVH
jgi:hypothetical protein